ncbi:uncharacterized protein H6S33_005664 [Morchella sextelata]|uniref:uncharacterized protein n=1 Tax=Morchella sextelata TaxID=1174677 RepID=UPI001D050B57|nr:uncharacterized protein H6S33_005664 [Morchella sextelata]KAH0613778.1 hypothetical protein H6S33_005664 [Morchella sextelata]
MMSYIPKNRIQLRELQASNLHDFHRIWSNPNATKWTTYGNCSTLSQSQTWLEILLLKNPSSRNYGVFLKESSRMIGIVGCFRTDSEVGYIFVEEFWGRGYASEALGKWLETYGGDGVIGAKVKAGNGASVKVLGKCGFVPVESTEGENLLAFERKAVKA